MLRIPNNSHLHEKHLITLSFVTDEKISTFTSNITDTNLI